MKDIIKKYLNGIFEGLNNPLPIILKKEEWGYGTEFDIGNRSYQVTIERTSEDDCCYLFKFSSDGSFELTNDIKNAFSVIPTIENIAKDFINNNKPNLFIFIKTDDSKGRDRMYREFTERTSLVYGYQYIIKQNNNLKLYILKNDNVTEDQLINSIEYILNNYTT